MREIKVRVYDIKDIKELYRETTAFQQIPAKLVIWNYGYGVIGLTGEFIDARINEPSCSWVVIYSGIKPSSVCYVVEQHTKFINKKDFLGLAQKVNEALLTPEALAKSRGVESVGGGGG